MAPDTPTEPKKGRGGSRKHPADCKCGACPVMGRRKTERPTNANVALKVLKEANAEQLWLSMIELEKFRLGIGAKAQLLQRATNVEEITDEHGVKLWKYYGGHASIIPLMTLLRYLEDRAHGRPMDTVNHLHNKPQELTVTHTLSERFKIAMEKAERRLAIVS